MASDFFTDLFDAVTGQKAAPQQTIIPTSDLLSQSYGALSSQIAPGLVAFNQALAPGLTDVQLGVTNQLDPNILLNYRGANQSFLDQLNMGEALSPELTADITRKLLETGAATGFGGSSAGIGNTILQTALQGEARGRQRRLDSSQAGTTGLQLSNQLYDPAKYTGLGAVMASGIGADLRGVQAARDDYENIKEDIRRKNFASLINTGGRIIGTVAGGVFGGAAGAQIGGGIGGSLAPGSGVAGYGQQQQQQQQGGGFTSLLNGLFGGGGGIGGPQYGIGSQSAGSSGSFGLNSNVTMAG